MSYRAVLALSTIAVGWGACGSQRGDGSSHQIESHAPLPIAGQEQRDHSADPAAPRPDSAAAAALEADEWREVGSPPRRLHLKLGGGHLEVSDEAGVTRFASGPEEQVYIYGFAVAPITQPSEAEILIWFARRDSNLHGVVPHDSGWMDYGDTPWIHLHLGVLGVAGVSLEPRWISSGLGERIEAVSIEPGPPGAPATIVAIQRGPSRRRDQVRYRFRNWALEIDGRRPLPRTHVRPASSDGLVDLAFVGDVMLGRTVGARLSDRGYEHAFAAILPWLASSDVVVGNLESCFGAPPPIGAGPMAFFAPPEHAAALAYLGFDILNLGNNHCTQAAKAASRHILAREGIAAIGARPLGLDRRPHMMTIAGLDIGVIGGMVWPTTEARVRQNMTPQIAANLQRAAASVDFLAVTLHWGTEYAPEPSPAQRRLARWLIDQGVDAVIGHHPHVIQPVERYRDGLIAYSLGNFVFDQEGYIPAAKGATERGLLLHIRVHERLGWTAREIATCIADRHVVSRCRSERPAREE